MLFPIHPETRQCEVFAFLNDELLNFFAGCIHATEFNHELFFGGEEDACWINRPTRDRFNAVWCKLPTSVAEKQALFELIDANQDLATFFDDDSLEIPTIPDSQLSAALGDLTSHLFTRTKKLSGVKSVSGDCIEQHYQDFCALNRSQLCASCGTELLSQNRADLEDSEQWNADYDHLLYKANYPIFAAHPANFIPTCHTCNSKAKGSSDLLRNGDGSRRKAFYPLPPLLESCHEYIRLIPQARSKEEYQTIPDINPLLEINFAYTEDSEQIRGKINVWEEVYQVPSRVRWQLSNTFDIRIFSDLRPVEGSFDDFCSQLQRHSSLPDDWRSTEWRFWWFKFYEWLYAQAESVKRDFWELILWKRRQLSDDHCYEEFGI